MKSAALLVVLVGVAMLVGPLQAAVRCYRCREGIGDSSTEKTLEGPCWQPKEGVTETKDGCSFCVRELHIVNGSPGEIRRLCGHKEFHGSKCFEHSGENEPHQRCYCAEDLCLPERNPQSWTRAPKADVTETTTSASTNIPLSSTPETSTVNTTAVSTTSTSTAEPGPTTSKTSKKKKKKTRRITVNTSTTMSKKTKRHTTETNASSTTQHPPSSSPTVHVQPDGSTHDPIDDYFQENDSSQASISSMCLLFSELMLLIAVVVGPC